MGQIPNPFGDWAEAHGYTTNNEQQIENAKSLEFVKVNGEDVSLHSIDMPVGTMFSAEKPMTLPKFALRLYGIGFMPLGDIQVLNGQAGHGKTFTLSIYCTALLRGSYMGLTTDIQNAKVLVIDTEQQEYNIRLFQQRVHYLCGWNLFENNERFVIRSFRNVETIHERRLFTLKSILEVNPDVVFVDGMADLLESVNDDKESAELVREFMKRSYMHQCAICSVLHFNPGTNKMRGHAGSETERKVSDALTTSYDEKTGTFTVKQVKARNRKIADLNFKIVDVTVENIDEAKTKYSIGIPVEANMDISQLKGEAGRVRVYELIKKALEGKGRVTKAELIDTLIKDHLGETEAQIMITAAEDYHFIDHNGRGYKFTGLPEGDGSPQLPF